MNAVTSLLKPGGKAHFKKYVLLLLLMAPIMLLAQTKTVTGTVKDDAGNPLSGTAITVKGKKTGTQTDLAGKFRLSVTVGETILVSNVAYENLEMPIDSRNDYEIVLKTKSKELENVVVVAYGTQKKASVTGAIAQVKGDAISKAPVGSVVNALQGKLPGLTFVQQSGQPGSDVGKIDIRGFGNALVIVDGTPSDFSQIDPNEIESISILKDGSAAIYGFKAANGAILVTTKRGTTGKPVISYSGYYGRQSTTRYPRLMNAGEFTELTDESQINQDLPVVYGADEVQKWKTGADSLHKSTDWYNSVLRSSAPMAYSNLNVSGGTDVIKYFFSGGYLDQQGLLRSKDTWFKRYNIRSTISAKISKRLTAEMNLSGRFQNTYNPNTGYTANGIINILQRTYPTSSLYVNNNPDYLTSTNISNNALAQSRASYSGYNSDQTRTFTGIGTLTYEVPYIQGLNAKLFFSYESDNDNSKGWAKQYALYNYDASTHSYNVAYLGNSPSSLDLFTSQVVSTDLQFSLNYTHTFASNHHVSGLLLFSRQKSNATNFGASRNFAVDALDQLQLGDLTGQTNYVSSSPFYQTAYQGYSGRLNYDYKGKYLLEASGKYAYSWKFPNNTGFFPGLQVGWKISNEPFFKIQAINNLKLRASWAEMPDDASASGFQYLTGYNYPSGAYVFSNGTVTNGLTPGSLANTTITWQVAHSYNAGLELGLWKNMITAELDVFYRKRTGIPATLSGSLPGTVGASLPQQNLNSDNTRGFELQLAFNKKIGDVSLTVSPNITYTRTKKGIVTHSPYSNSLENYLKNKANRWADEFWGYKAVGQFKTQDEINSWAVQDGQANKTLQPGDVKYLDVNHDGILDSRDQTLIGKGLTPDGYGNPATTPKLFYGLNLSATYKQFDISAVFAGASDFDIVLGGAQTQPFANNSNSYAYFTDRWHHADIYDPKSAWIPGRYPATVTNGKNNNNGILSDGQQHPTSFWLQDATYLRLKTIQLAYSLPTKLLTKAGIKDIRFYVAGQNLFLFTKAKYVDPEAPTAGSTGEGGGGTYYPQQKVITLGLNARF